MTEKSEQARKDLSEALRQGLMEDTENLTRLAVKAGEDPLDLIQTVLVPTLTEVGRQFQAFEIFLPELMAAGDAAQAATKILEAEIAASGRKSASLGTIVLGTVQNDIHDIGKNIVASLLKAQNFKVIDLGKDVPAATFLDAAETNKADVIAASALMSITRAGCRDVADLLRERKMEKKYFYIVGGGSITQEYADEIGANGFSETAGTAVEVVKKLMASKKGA